MRVFKRKRENLNGTKLKKKKRKKEGLVKSKIDSRSRVEIDLDQFSARRKFLEHVFVRTLLLSVKGELLGKKEACGERGKGLEVRLKGGVCEAR